MTFSLSGSVTTCHNSTRPPALGVLVIARGGSLKGVDKKGLGLAVHQAVEVLGVKDLGLTGGRPAWDLAVEQRREYVSQPVGWM
jgi:hypothetical protein